MKALISLYADLWNSIVYTIRKELFEMSYYSKCMSYEYYVMSIHPVDSVKMNKAHQEVKEKGRATFYSEVFKREITITTSYR